MVLQILHGMQLQTTHYVVTNYKLCSYKWQYITEKEDREDW